MAQATLLPCGGLGSTCSMHPPRHHPMPASQPSVSPACAAAAAATACQQRQQRFPRLGSGGCGTGLGWHTSRPTLQQAQAGGAANSSIDDVMDVVSGSSHLVPSSGSTSQRKAGSASGSSTGSSGAGINSTGSSVPQRAEQELELLALETLPIKEARAEWLAVWVGAAAAFGAFVWATMGAEKAQEFFAGYVLEQSLSIDNLFVFVLVFNYFQTPSEVQNKVLTYGILSAAVLRAIMILAGVALISDFQPVLLLFAGILLYSSYKLLVASDLEEEEDLKDNFVVKACRRLIPVSDTYDGDRFFTYRNGVKTATPLLLTLAVVELSDVIFAVDSIPAVFGVTVDPFIVYTSNIFAILSLRSLYGFVSTVMAELRYLDKAVALVLGFIGVKMVLGFADLDIPTDVSLGVVAALLATGVGASLAFPGESHNKTAASEGDKK